MTAGQRPNGQRAEALGAHGDVLRAENDALRAELALRDLALDATPSFFLITRQEKPAPIIVYCNRVVAEQHGYRREDLIGQPISLLDAMDRTQSQVIWRRFRRLAAPASR